tara:strand:+ start:647 stop:1006 length:360 start_codon:yes stop_codon:yes gene_type:complete
MNFKINEIREYFNDFISEQPDEWLAENWDDLHHHAFNTDYYVIGFARAREWLGDEVFNAIQFIKEYEQDNFGKVYTDFSDAETVVNMYVFILGEEIVERWKNRNEEIFRLIHKDYAPIV